MTVFGINVPYLDGAYGHDLAESPRFPTWPCDFTAMSAYRPLIEARRMGASAIRIWLCENAEGIVVDDSGHVMGMSERLLQSVAILQEAAHLHGLSLYFCLLDGNAWPREQDPITRSILADRDQAERFAERVVAPLARRLDREVVFGVDVINEPETSTEDCIEDSTEPIAWEDIGRVIRLADAAVQAERPGLMVTSGTMHVFLPKLWHSGAGLRAVDVHIYHPNGGLPSREDLAAYVGDPTILDPAIPIVGGELGIPGEHHEGEEHPMCNYVINAPTLGYHGAFLWQLDGDLVDKQNPKRPFTWLGRQVRHAFADAR